MLINVFIAVLFTVFMVLMIACSCSMFFIKDRTKEKTTSLNGCLYRVIEENEASEICKWIREIVSEQALAGQDNLLFQKHMEKVRTGRTYGAVIRLVVWILKYYPTTKWSVILYQVYNFQASLCEIMSRPDIPQEMKRNSEIGLNVCDCFLYYMRKNNLLTE